MQVRSKKNETNLVGAIRAGCKGVTSHHTFFWRSRVLAEDGRDVKSPHVFPRVSKKNETDLVGLFGRVQRYLQ